MRHKTHHLYYLFYPRSWIIIALLLFTTTVFAQEQTPPDEFQIGAKIGDKPTKADSTLDSYLECGFNAIWWDSYSDSKPYLDEFGGTLLADNGRSRYDYINHYATGYYSKWEAEQDQENNRVGVKHGQGQGQPFEWNGAQCWSTIGLSAPACSLIYGPHYRQDKRYKRWIYDEPGWSRYNLDYNVRYRMALSKSSGIPDDEEVCRIMVVYRYAEVYPDQSWDYGQDTFLVKTLRVQDFPDGGEFAYISFDSTYRYPEKFWITEIYGKDYEYKLEIPPADTITYNDTEAGLGIQFWVDWLRTDNLCTLYVDNIEVYDNDGWNRFIDRPEEITSLIKNYADSVTNKYSYLKYFYTHDEPYSIDAFIPYHTVEQIVMGETDIPLITEFYPYWTHDGTINGEDFLQQWYDIGQPEKLMIDFYPFSPDYPFRFTDAEELRKRLQKCSELQPGFWYSAQASGTWVNGNWKVWRLPTSEEFNASVMLGLAHGISGVILFSYTSFGVVRGIVDNREEEEFTKTHLWYQLNDYLIPRLKGNLGKTLMSLNYSGNFLKFQRRDQESPPPPVEFNYLTLSEGTPSMIVMNWHCGFFDRAAHPDDNYFMLANLITTDAKNVKVTLKPPVNTPFTNYRFRNIEGLFDTTFSAPNIFEMQVEHSAGEGYLYQFSPVIQYGGKLIFDDSLSSEKTLVDDLIIKNGKTLTINATYNADRSIKIREGGRLVTTSGGTVKFYNNQNLIIEGTATIAGTPQNKLVLDFLNPTERNGIIIKPGGSLTIVNCEIRNAGTGIFSELNANYLSAQNVDFINCADYSINITGRTAGMYPTLPPQITGCTMLNSNYGIAISNLPGMLIYNNDITNTACGIYLSNVTDAQIIGNTIISNREELEGIFILSSGGAIRANLITGHTVGLQLANSSPILGSNVFTANKYHGLYIGDGSRPYMRQGQWVGFPPNMYATSGYNKIFQNGGYEGEGNDNDGSEIYFVNSNAAMDKGCNSIYDDREPSPPLVNTELLMNCPEWSPIEVDARGNYWGDRVYERRFGWLGVNYIPYSETPCPEPQDVSAGELVRMTSFGDVIDTVYAVDIEIPDLTETEEAYAEAEEYFLTGNLTNALQIYEGIISSTASEEEKYPAYQRKYSIGKLTGQSVEYFNLLSNTFATLSSSTQDTLNKKILNQLSTLSKVGEQEY